MQYIISKSLKLPQIYNFSNIARILAVSKFLTRTEISNFTFEVLKSHTDLITPNWSTTKWFSINAPHWLFKFGIYSKLHEFVTFWNFFVETPQSWHCLIQNFQNALNTKHTNIPFTQIMIPPVYRPKYRFINFDREMTGWPWNAVGHL